MQPIPLAVLKDAKQRLTENAAELLEDALHLHVDERFSRAFALPVLAREELGKLGIVCRAIYDIEQRASVDWERFRRRTKDHGAKLKMAAFVQVIYSSNLAGHPDVKGELIRRANQPRLRQLLEDGKLDGMHVKISSVGCSSPSDVVDQDMSSQVHEGARILLAFFQGHELSGPDSHFAGITDLTGKMIRLADDLSEDPESVTLPR